MDAGASADVPPTVRAPAPESAAPAARSPFEASANEALSFRLVRTAAELATALTFHPEFTHQVFGEDDTIFGYRDLQARAAAASAAPPRALRGAQRARQPAGRAAAAAQAAQRLRLRL